MVSPIAMMIPPPPPEMSMALLRAQLRQNLQVPMTTPPSQAIQEPAHQVDLRA